MALAFKAQPRIARAAATLVALLLVSCAPMDFSTSPVQPSRSPSPRPTSGFFSEEEITEFRVAAGLRSDSDWIHKVAEDPKSDWQFWVPLTSQEKTALLTSADPSDWISVLVRMYGVRYPGDFGGSYIDRSTSSRGIVVAEFVDHIATHEPALQRFPAGSIRLETVQWTLSELESLQIVVEQSDDVFGRFGATLSGVGVDPRQNLVVIRLRTPDNLFPDGLLAALGAEGRALLELDGFDFASLPTGTLSGKVVDGSGRGLEGLDIHLLSDVGPYDPRGDAGVVTMEDGVVLLENMPAMGYRVDVLRFIEGAWQIVGSTRVVVAEGQTGSFLIVTGGT